MRKKKDLKEFICSDCINEPYVEALIQNEGEEGDCPFCDSENKLISLERLATITDKVIQALYRPTASEPEGYELSLLKDKESHYLWEREGITIEDIIVELLGTDDEVAERLGKVLRDENYDIELAKMGEEGFYDDEVRYEEVLPNEENYSRAWFEFENNIKKTSRYFGHEEFLNKIFKDINNLDKGSKNPIVQVVGPKRKISSIFRARVMHPEKLEHALANLELELSPPSLNQSKPGRMNPHGIATFYGALNYQTAIAEVRPPIDAKVIVGKFDFIKDLRVLDLNALGKIEINGSIFDPEHRKKIELTRFLSSLGARMSKPVLPDDEPFEYLSTQIISDFLAWNKEINLQGIIYPSSYSDNEGQNVVIFSGSAIVDKFDIQKRSNIDVSLGYEDEDGFNEHISVREEFPEKDAKAKEKLDLLTWHDFYKEEEKETTLKLDKLFLKVYHINGVSLKYSEANVEYHSETVSSLNGRVKFDF
jgi:hypothetical protein